jgi:hypothetical protein
LPLQEKLLLLVHATKALGLAATLLQKRRQLNPFSEHTGISTASSSAVPAHTPAADMSTAPASKKRKTVLHCGVPKDREAHPDASVMYPMQISGNMHTVLAMRHQISDAKGKKKKNSQGRQSSLPMSRTGKYKAL